MLTETQVTVLYKVGQEISGVPELSSCHPLYQLNATGDDIFVGYLSKFTIKHVLEISDSEELMIDTYYNIRKVCMIDPEEYKILTCEIFQIVKNCECCGHMSHLQHTFEIIVKKDSDWSLVSYVNSEDDLKYLPEAYTPDIARVIESKFKEYLDKSEQGKVKIEIFEK
jgi:hypothetical protein